MSVLTAPAVVRLSDKEFYRLRDVVYRQCGINLTIGKRILLESRLRKRIAVLGLSNYNDYCDYLLKAPGNQQEIVEMIDAVSTNKTDFFREPGHFQFLKDIIMPQWLMHHRQMPYKVWSSACSSGEEPYTLAMVLQDIAIRDPFEFNILATDISTKVLSKAASAIYPARLADTIPADKRKRYLLRSKDVTNPTIRISPLLRSKVQFQRLNLIQDIPSVNARFDLILCRNVLIYFDRPTQETVLRNLLTRLTTDGYLFIGHSESIYEMELPLRQIRPTIFQKINNE